MKHTQNFPATSPALKHHIEDLKYGARQKVVSPGVTVIDIVHGDGMHFHKSVTLIKDNLYITFATTDATNRHKPDLLRFLNRLYEDKVAVMDIVHDFNNHDESKEAVRKMVFSFGHVDLHTFRVGFSVFGFSGKLSHASVSDVLTEDIAFSTIKKMMLEYASLQKA